MLVQELRAFSDLRSMPSERIVNEFSDQTRKQFSQFALDNEVIPVAVPVKNEEEDMPALLVSMSRSEAPLFPIIVDNGSTDATIDYARQMIGVDPLIWAEPGKMGATQLAIRYSLEEFGNTLLFTDGDTLIRPNWAKNMKRAMQGIPGEEGLGVFGVGIYAHGESRAVDFARTTSFMAKGLIGKMLQRDPRATGFNYGLRFDRDGAMQAAIDGLDPHIFRGDDRAIRDAVVEAGAPIIGAVGLSTAVISRGDRMSSFLDLLQPDAKREEVRRLSYEQQYGVMPAYTPNVRAL